jgi:hypothetical protein
MSQPPLLDPKRRRRQRWIRRIVLWLLLVALSFYVFLNTRDQVQGGQQPAGIQTRV